MTLSARNRFRAAVALTLIALGVQTANVMASTVSDLYANGSNNPGPFSFNAVVSGILNTYTTGGVTTNNFVLQDSTGSIEAYNVPTTTYTPVVGENLAVTGTNVPYEGGAEVGASATYAPNPTGTIVPTYPVVTASQVSASDSSAGAVPPYAEAIVTLDNVRLSTISTAVDAPSTIATKTIYYVIDSTGSADLYSYFNSSVTQAAVNAANASNAVTGFYDGPVDITGFVAPFGSFDEIYPTSITPAPEPASLSILGLAGIGVLKRRRRA